MLEAIKAFYTKLQMITHLFKTRTYVLVTDRDAFFYVYLTGLLPETQLAWLKDWHVNLGEIIKEMEKTIGEKNGGNKSRRPKSRSN